MPLIAIKISQLKSRINYLLRSFSEPQNEAELAAICSGNVILTPDVPIFSNPIVMREDVLAKVAEVLSQDDHAIIMEVFRRNYSMLESWNDSKRLGGPFDARSYEVIHLFMSVPAYRAALLSNPACIIRAGVYVQTHKDDKRKSVTVWNDMYHAWHGFRYYSLGSESPDFELTLGVLQQLLVKQASSSWTWRAQHAANEQLREDLCRRFYSYILCWTFRQLIVDGRSFEFGPRHSKKIFADKLKAWLALAQQNPGLMIIVKAEISEMIESLGLYLHAYAEDNKEAYVGLIEFLTMPELEPEILSGFDCNINGVPSLLSIPASVLDQPGQLIMAKILQRLILANKLSKKMVAFDERIMLDIILSCNNDPKLDLATIFTKMSLEAQSALLMQTQEFFDSKISLPPPARFFLCPSSDDRIEIVSPAKFCDRRLSDDKDHALEEKKEIALKLIREVSKNICWLVTDNAAQIDKTIAHLEWLQQHDGQQALDLDYETSSLLETWRAIQKSTSSPSICVVGP